MFLLDQWLVTCFALKLGRSSEFLFRHSPHVVIVCLRVLAQSSCIIVTIKQYFGSMSIL